MPSPTPQLIRRVLVHESVQDGALARRVRQRTEGIPWLVLPRGATPPPDPAPGRDLVLAEQRGRFLKPCPGATRHICCGYRVLHLAEGCPLACSYCILKAYFREPALTVFANSDRLLRELGQALTQNPDRRLRVGTGEFADSLALEPLTGQAAELVEFLSGFSNVRLELKSKVADLSWLAAAKRPETVLPAWSVNAPEIQAREEPGSASIEARLAAAKECARLGFRVCLHFDPVLRHPGWERGYAEAVDLVLDHLYPRDVAYVSLGSFRFLPALKGIVEREHPQARFLYDEFAPGLDGKMRLLRPLRVAQLRFLAGRLSAGGLGDKLYLCMESPEVWRGVLGSAPRGTAALGRRLLDLAFGA
jgi:spore photoproduct lyase